MTLGDVLFPFFGVMLSPLSFGYIWALHAFEWAWPSRVMRMARMCMFALATMHFKVLRAIVKRIAVDMMHHLFWIKKPTKLLFHHKAMLVNVTPAVGIRMVRREDLHILSDLSPASVPTRVVFPVLWGKSIFSHGCNCNPCLKGCQLWNTTKLMMH